MTLKGRKEEIQKSVFRIPANQELREEVLARTLVILRPWECIEMVWNSMLFF